MIVFRAYAVPTPYSTSLVDHTWIETSSDYWYCWGNRHTPGRSLGTRLGDASFAACLVKPNVDCASDSAARGTIYVYGVDGVCHQLANQVAWATSVSGMPPLVVSLANGYKASTFVYGVYGRLTSIDWAKKKARCTPGTTTESNASDEGLVQMIDDDFPQRARALLGDTAKLGGLLAIRESLTKSLESLRAEAGQSDPDVFAKRANDLINDHFGRAAEVLDPSEFRALFEFAPTDRITLVDPEIARSQAPGRRRR
jgi:hypothetical protein